MITLVQIHIPFCSIHVVFGQVVSGQDIVKQIENLPVDRNSRPLEEATVIACGELVKQAKGMLNNFLNDAFINMTIQFLAKKDKKKKKSATKSDTSSDSSDSAQSAKKLKKQKKKKKDKKAAKEK